MTGQPAFGFSTLKAWRAERPRLADVFSAVSALFYTFEMWRFTRIQYSVLDEGLYLYKGWLFASGEYAPFQPYGPWTNQMPLAFLVPGWVQLVFGPGLQTGRTFAFVLGLLTALALWLTARRLSGPWTAGLILAAVALNPAAARMVSMAASQGVVACLLAWTMFFSLGEGRKDWQLALAGLLAGAAVMMRINLLPVLPLLLLYVWWAYGRKSALWVLAGELLVFGGLHLFYWPNILQAWARWFPLPFLAPWGPPPNAPTWNPDNPDGFRVASFFLAFRYHFAALVGALASWVFWPKAWKSVMQRKAAVFLSVLFVSFFLLHAWAALGNEYCVFCFPTYTSFYSGIGLMLVAVTLPLWRLDASAPRKWLGALGMLGLLAGMAYSAEGTVESLLDTLRVNFYKWALSLPTPGFGGAQIWQVVANKFQVEYTAILDAVHAWFPVALAVGFGLGLLAAGKVPFGRQQAANSAASSESTVGAGASPVARALLGFALLGMLFSPSRLLAGEYNSYDCPADVLPGYQAVGAELAEVIPLGASLYWDGYSPAALLALPDVKIYPAQLHSTYSFRLSDDDDALAKYGWWNQHLAEGWLGEADFVLLEARNLPSEDWLARGLMQYEEVAVTGLQAVCQPDSFFYVFRRK